MTAPDVEARIERILIAFDATRESLPALEAAATMAALLRAELAGLFIEDEDVLNLAALPFAREVGYGVPRQRGMDRATVEREFRVVAGEARQALEAAAATRRVRCSFRVVRGRVEREMRGATAATDIVAVWKATRRVGPARRLGSAARVAAAGGASAVLLAEPGHAAAVRRILVAYDASPCAERALTVAGRLAAEGESFLEVLLLAGDGESARRLEGAAEGRLEGSGAKPRFRTLPPGDLDALKRVIDVGPGALLVLGAECYPLDREALERLLGETGAPVLLIRSP